MKTSVIYHLQSVDAPHLFATLPTVTFLTLWWAHHTHHFLLITISDTVRHYSCGKDALVKVESLSISIAYAVYLHF